MSAGTSLAFPGGRVLAAWWRQLAPHRPLTLWVGHLLLHHVEALVRLRRSHRPDPLALLLLRAVALEHPHQPSSNNHAGDDALGRLDSRLHLGRQVLLQAVQALCSAGLVQGEPQGPWGLSPLGSHALQAGEYPQTAYERRRFHFLDLGPPTPGRTRFAFLGLRSHDTIPWPAGEGWTFDVAELQACITRPREWKEHAGFPEDIEAVITPAAPEDAAPETPVWQRVVVERPERLPAAILRVPADNGLQRLLGFPAKQEGWLVQTAEPAFVLKGESAETMAESLGTPAPEAWREAWRQWCGPRGLPEAEVAACVLHPDGAMLRVRAPARLVERLRVARSDALKGEAWLLAGDGPIRSAACVELAEGVGS